MQDHKEKLAGIYGLLESLFLWIDLQCDSEFDALNCIGDRSLMPFEYHFQFSNNTILKITFILFVFLYSCSEFCPGPSD